MFTCKVGNRLVLQIISAKCFTKTLSAANSGLHEHLERAIPISNSECHYLAKPQPLRKTAGFSPSAILP